MPAPTRPPAPREITPRHPDGTRDWHRLSLHECLVVAHLYKARYMRATRDEIMMATGLSGAQFYRVQRDLCSPVRGNALRVPGPVLRLVPRRVKDAPEIYSPSAEWRRSNRTPPSVDIDLGFAEHDTLAPLDP